MYQYRKQILYEMLQYSIFLHLHLVFCVPGPPRTFRGTFNRVFRISNMSKNYSISLAPKEEIDTYLPYNYLSADYIQWWKYIWDTVLNPSQRQYNWIAHQVFYRQMFVSLPHRVWRLSKIFTFLCYWTHVCACPFLCHCCTLWRYPQSLGRIATLSLKKCPMAPLYQAMSK